MEQKTVYRTLKEMYRVKTIEIIQKTDDIDTLKKIYTYIILRKAKNGKRKNDTV